LVLNFRPKSAATDKVESALTPDPYTCGPEASLSEVAGAMASEKFGCVLVMTNGKLAGIFTSVDALRLLADIFKDEIDAQP
jgi:acetoin utilization protein AcuB